MGDKTNIGYVDATWNPVIGCSPVSEGCLNCYAASMASRFCQKGEYYEGVVVPLTKPLGGGLWTGHTVRKTPKFNPLNARKPRTIFVCSMGDLFHESVPDGWIDKVMAVICKAIHHRFMILTKRPERMLRYFTNNNAPSRCSLWRRWAKNFKGLPDGNVPDYLPISPANPTPPNLALGVSVSNQEDADRWLPSFLQTPAAYRFVSYEPALGPVDFHLVPGRYGRVKCRVCDGDGSIDAFDPNDYRSGAGGKMCVACEGTGVEGDLDLIIMGGESGPNARPMNPEWVRSVRDQCRQARVPFNFKQWGDIKKTANSHAQQDAGFCRFEKKGGRDLDGQLHDEHIRWR